MATMNISEVVTDKRTGTAPTPASTAIAAGNLMWWDATNHVMNNASARTDLGSAAANQADFAPIFLGVSADQRLVGETTTGHDSIRTYVAEGVFDCLITSGTYAIGQLVGVARDSVNSVNLNQQLVTVATSNLAIGYIIGVGGPNGPGGAAYTGNATTVVRCWLSSYQFGYFAKQFNVEPGAINAGAALTLTAAQAGATVNLNTAAGSVVTLPAATGSGIRYRFVVTTTTTSGAHKILAASSSDYMIGNAYGYTGSTAKVFGSAAATNHSIQMPYTGSQPSGGFIGDWFEVTDVAANLWEVSGFYQAGTTPTTPYSTATS